MITQSVDWDCVPGCEVSHEVWDATPKGSPLRTFLLEWKVASQSRSDFAASVDQAPKEFLEDLAVLLMNQTETDNKSETAQEFATRIRAKLPPNRC
jgi:hypothetical protein